MLRRLIRRAGRVIEAGNRLELAFLEGRAMSIAALGSQFADVLRKEALGFALENKDDALELGEDAVRAVLAEAVDRQIQVFLPPLPAGATIKQLADREEYLEGVSRSCQLVAAVRRKNAMQVKALQEKATERAIGIAGSIAEVLIQAAVAGLMVGKK